MERSGSWQLAREGVRCKDCEPEVGRGRSGRARRGAGPHPAASVFDCAEHEAVLVLPAAQRVELPARSAQREAPGAQAMEQLAEHMRHEQCGVVH